MNINIKEIEKMVANQTYFSTDMFINSARDYIKAVKERRILCHIANISNMGNLQMKYTSCEKRDKNTFYYRNYYGLFLSMGYHFKGDLMKISFGNMDMNFNTNYNVIYKFYRLGLINKSTRDKLCQQTPTVI